MPTTTSPPIDKRRMNPSKNKQKGRNAKSSEADAKTRRETEQDLDEGLEETFPASDPVSINPGAD